MTKTYDQSYFDRWYRNPLTRVSSRAEVRRKVALAIAVTEYFIRRPIRTVLDIGCGEAAWLPHLRAFRPRIEYTGLDSSDYVVDRFGRSRNIRKAAFADLPALELGVYDLVVCSDVLHYLPDREIRAGVARLADVTDGVAFIEVLTREDDITGDLQGLVRRPASWYRRTLTSTGMTQAGPYCWLSPAFRGAVAELEAQA